MCTLPLFHLLPTRRLAPLCPHSAPHPLPRSPPRSSSPPIPIRRPAVHTHSSDWVVVTQLVLHQPLHLRVQPCDPVVVRRNAPTLSTPGLDVGGVPQGSEVAVGVLVAIKEMHFQNAIVTRLRPHPPLPLGPTQNAVKTWLQPTNQPNKRPIAQNQIKGGPVQNHRFRCIDF